MRRDSRVRFGIWKRASCSRKGPYLPIGRSASTLNKTMCRSIKVLRNQETPVTAEEIAAASLQFVRKVSGFRKPSKANQAAFDAAVQEIARSTERLLGHLSVPARSGEFHPKRRDASPRQKPT